MNSDKIALLRFYLIKKIESNQNRGASRHLDLGSILGLGAPSLPPAPALQLVLMLALASDGSGPPEGERRLPV